MKSKKTKKALTGSVLALVLCFVMLLGTTFAWFTDTASTSVNKIQAGTLDIALEMMEGNSWVSAEGKTLDFVKEANHASEAILWEPGVTYNLPELRIVNNGNLAIKYKVVISGINGDAKLNEAITWTMNGLSLDEGVALGVGEQNVFTISGAMDKNAGNEYQGLSIDGVAITVYATQDTVEFDSTTNQYDAEAGFDFAWDGKSTAPLTKDESGVYHITTAAQFVEYMNSINKNDGKEYYKVVLDSDIDLGGHTYEVSGTAAAFSGTFDGQNHTVSNYVIKRDDTCSYTGLFSISSWSQDGRTTTFKNLTVENGTVISKGPQVSAILPNVETKTDATAGAILENCHAVNCTVIGEKKVGAVTGYVCTNSASFGATVKNCSAENCNIYASDSRDDQVTVFGYDNSGTFTNNTDKGGNTVKCGVTTVSNAAELAAALDNAGNAPSYDRNIVLTADIDGSVWTAIPGGSNYPAVTIDGNGHTIKNLSSCLFSSLHGRDYVFKNINFTNVNLTEASGSNKGLGVIVGEGMANGGGSYKITNCHINGGKIDGGSTKYVGGFIGFKSIGADVTFTDCSVKNLKLTSAEESIGAFAGHLYDKVTFNNCAVKGNTSVTYSKDRNGSAAKGGILVGTVYDTEVTNCTIDSTVTLSNNNAAATLSEGLFGRHG